MLHATSAAARRARDGTGARLRTDAVAAGAGGDGLEGNLPRHTLHRFDELELHLCREVGTARAARRRAAEKILAEERREDVGEVSEVERAGSEPAAAQTGVAVAVVELARLGVDST